MPWNQFENVRPKLNLYDNPNFEPGSGITDRDVLIDCVEKIAEEMNNEPHPIVKAKAIEFVLDNTAIEVNPLDWFGLNYCGWLTWNAAKKIQKRTFMKRPSNVQNESWFAEIEAIPVKKPLEILNRRWFAEIKTTPEYDEAVKDIKETGTGYFGPDYDHSVPDWDSVINLGFKGILERAEKYYQEKKNDGSLTEKQNIYYQSVFITYKAIIRLVCRFLECAKKHEADSKIMPLMIECLEVIANGKPQTLYQFLMIIYIYHLLQENMDIIQVRTLGNLDVDGYPFYKKDIEEGILTSEQTEELFQFFFEKYTNQGHLHAQPLYFGGFNENGDSLINELSYIMLTAYDKSCIVNPKLFIKVMPNTPDTFLKKALEMIRRGRNCIVFINEELGCEISRKLGRTEEETRRLVGTGCNNFASRGKETTPEHMYVNLAKGIELVFTNGKDPLTGAPIGCETGNVSEFENFEDFKNAYIKQTEYLIDKAFIISDFYDSHLSEINPAPMYSGTMPDSVKCGRDAYHDGVTYNNTVMFLSCHATAADSLMMVKKHVYDLRTVSIETLQDALLKNWVGYEELRELMLSDPEKFGNDIDSVDSIAVEMLDHFTTKVTNRKNMRGGHFVVNGESIWFSHIWADKCGATPDGRAKGDLLSKNMSASIGQDRRGITAHIKSVTKIDATKLAYGCPFDYMLHPSAVKGEDGLDAMLGLLRTFMKRGGYGYQGNVQDVATLKDAQLHPEKHQNLQVRISGWSWFFTQMEKNFQDEFIRRAELEERAI